MFLLAGDDDGTTARSGKVNALGSFSAAHGEEDGTDKIRILHLFVEIFHCLTKVRFVFGLHKRLFGLPDAIPNAFAGRCLAIKRCIS